MPSRPKTVLALIDLVQDFDVLAPVLFALQAEPSVRVKVLVSRWLIRRAPRIVRSLRGRLDFRYVARRALLSGRGPGLDGVHALLTASESSASPHRWSRALVVRAKAAGIRCFTLQHGLDNLEVMAAGAGRGQDIASDIMFCWAPEAQWPTGLDPGLRAKLVSVGRPRSPRPVQEPRFDVGIFENLHARTYSDDDRHMFLARTLGLCLSRPDLRLYVRSHPAGGWLDRAAPKLAAAKNVAFVSSSVARGDALDGASAAAGVAKVITTPSTIALDAAQAGREVAITQNGGALYRPLRVLEALEDWITFADAPDTSGDLSSAFVARHVVPSDAASRIATMIAASEETYTFPLI